MPDTAEVTPERPAAIPNTKAIHVHEDVHLQLFRLRAEGAGPSLRELVERAVAAMYGPPPKRGG